MFYSNIKTEAIVLSEKEFGENDKIFSLYTKEFGKIEVLGKSIRKLKAKLRYGLQVLNYISLEFVKGKNFNIATDALLKDFFGEVKKDSLLFRKTLYICFILDKLLVGEEKDRRVWQLLTDTLFSIKKGETKIITRYFEWVLLSFLGFEPELYYCVNCQEKIKGGRIFFSAKRGGVLCQECRKGKKLGIEVSRDFVKILRLIIHQEKDIIKRLQITKAQEDELKKISRYYLSSVLEERIFVI